VQFGASTNGRKHAAKHTAATRWSASTLLVCCIGLRRLLRHSGACQEYRKHEPFESHNTPTAPASRAVPTRLCGPRTVTHVGASHGTPETVAPVTVASYLGHGCAEWRGVVVPVKNPPHEICTLHTLMPGERTRQQDAQAPHTYIDISKSICKHQERPPQTC